ncbi:hypothetical protein BV22DRAFT_835771 [Leucogyrophana mollusca]|uniref:Uncharacterized protein n=1 Tax=Leucogyrophana mollusca TaxID=85980 RepID=A0ACB8B309_9AGAM|nr:hypothetical protein BV22DRAFT_835771 [Leucogyrophana mollusca]
MCYAQSCGQCGPPILNRRSRILIYVRACTLWDRLLLASSDPSHPLPFRNRRAIPDLIFPNCSSPVACRVMSTVMSQSALVSALNVIQWTRICQFVPCVMVVYDHLLTLDGEVRPRSRRCCSSCNYFLIRRR